MSLARAESSSGAALAGKVTTVLVAGPGRHCFHHLRGPAIRMLDPPAESSAEPDVIVIPANHPVRESSLFELPEGIRRRVAAGRSVIVFDSSGEGHPHQDEDAHRYHRIAANIGAPLRACVYLTQNRTYREDYDAFCDREGADDRMRIVTYDYWIRRAVFDHEGDGLQVFEARLEAFNRRKPSRERRFISLNLTPRPHRILFLLRLLKDNLWKDGFISVGLGFEIDEPRHRAEQVRKNMRKLQGFEGLYREVAPYMEKLEAVGPQLLGDIRTEPGGQRTAEVPWGDTLRDEHDRTWFTIVPETEMRKRPERITEKCLKPLLNFHPLIVLGNPGSLRLIREYGFQTFGSVFDETYDDEPDPRQRFELVYGQVVRLCALEQAELGRMEAALADTLTFNARWGLTELPAIFRAKIDCELVGQILGL